ncbi:MAG: outer membrane beta-barrel protein [Muribaculaceae bacterium]|nr:outer membrane beta-barrel protein [Muribaculaceae bacterium]
MLKKFFSLILFLAIALQATAEFRWGPTLGVNFSTLSWRQKLAKTSGLTGFDAGVAGELMIPGIGFGIDMGLRYNLHGAKVNFGDHHVWAIDGIKNQNVWFHTLEIPLNLKFKWTRLNGFEQILAPFIYGGPVFNFTLATNKAPAIEHPAGYVAMQVALGAELFEHYQISAGYSWGVSYQVRTIKLDNYTARPRGAIINLAYLF